MTEDRVQTFEVVQYAVQLVEVPPVNNVRLADSYDPASAFLDVGLNPTSCGHDIHEVVGGWVRGHVDTSKFSKSGILNFGGNNTLGTQKKSKGLTTLETQVPSIAFNYSPCSLQRCSLANWVMLNPAFKVAISGRPTVGNLGIGFVGMKVAMFGGGGLSVKIGDSPNEGSLDAYIVMDPHFINAFWNSFNGFKSKNEPSHARIDRFNSKDKSPDLNYKDCPSFQLKQDPGYPVLPSTVEPTKIDSQYDSDLSNYVLKDIMEMLMSDEIEQKASMFVDPLALQAVEQSLYEVLGTKYPPSPNQHTIFYPSKFSCIYNCNNSNTMSDSVLLSTSAMPSMGGSFDGMTHSFVSILFSQNSHHSIGESMTLQFRSGVEEVKKSFPCQNISIINSKNYELPPMSMDDTPKNEVEKNEKDFLFNCVGGKKDIRRKEANHMEEGRSGKQLTICDTEEDDLSETFDSLFLCPDEHEKHVMRTSNEVSQNGANKLLEEKGEISIFNAKNSLTKKMQKKEAANFRKLLILCARAIAINDIAIANDLLKKIRQHSSPFGCVSQRIAHYFANGLEARMIGSGSQIYVALSSKKPSVNLVDTLKAYETIIFQWPAFIEDLSTRFSEPPKLRIIGIEFPQSAKKWETIKIEDIKIRRHELIIVNSQYRLDYVPSESVMVNFPRDTVLKLIREINPDIFVHGIINGSCNDSFFVTCFRETLFYYSLIFDMLDANLTGKFPKWLQYEEQVWGQDIMNIIGCEGSDRILRCMTYKHWQILNVNMGFRPLLLDKEIIRTLRNKVKGGYHKDFTIKEDGHWMPQGWKYRFSFAISCWVSPSALLPTTPSCNSQPLLSQATSMHPFANTI
ncbi:scarecrow-like protein 33 [Malania oleifera]|uniref:scarecrow-like protein 33 n=1 Tax=Malania oleifera TaxID=397392 RepID=UPI0025AEAEA7|nr:scarecrow-like protein 33 [Malania oleifera]